jgi:glutaredoxin 3
LDKAQKFKKWRRRSKVAKSSCSPKSILGLAEAYFFWDCPIGSSTIFGESIGKTGRPLLFRGARIYPRYCPFCQRAKSILSSVGVAGLEVLELADMNKRPLVKDPAAIMDYMEKITGARTVPRLFIAGKFVGGCDQVLVVLLLHVAFVPCSLLKFEVEVLQSFPG